MAKLERLITPSGVKTISENGEYDVVANEKVFVDVEGKVEIPQVSNLAIDEDGILTFDLPDYSELEQYNPTISYIININDNVLETSGNSASVKEYATEGENNVVVITKVAINGLGKDGVVEYVPSEEGKYTIFTFNLTDETKLQPTIYCVTENPSSSIAPDIKTWSATIDWGDGTIDEYADTTSTRSSYNYQKSTPYASIGVYVVKITINDLTDKSIPSFKPSSSGNVGAYVKFITNVENVQTGFISIYKQAFSGAINLTNAVIPKGIIKIGANAFSNCSSLTYFDIPEGVTTIDNNAFYMSSYCHNATIVLPSTITSLGKGIFTNYTSNPNAPIKKIVFKSKVPPTLSSSSFVIDRWGNSKYDIEIVVPPESLEAYKTATNWIKYTNIVADTEG